MTDKLIFSVQKTELATKDTMLLLLKPNLPFSYEVGDYIMLGMDEEEFKPYSIASGPRKDGLIELHIRNQADTPFMAKLFEVKEGQKLLVTGPNKQYVLDDDFAGKDIILIGGGTGFAPMKALLDGLLASKITNNILFYWGASKTEDFYLHDDMIALSEQHENLMYEEVMPSLVHEKVMADFADLANKRVYLCGPWNMINTVKTDFMAQGLLEENYN